MVITNFRKFDWLNTDTLKTVFGVQAKIEHQARWANLAENGKPVFFDTEIERDAKIKLLRKENKSKLTTI